MKLKNLDFASQTNRLWMFPLSENLDWFRCCGMFSRSIDLNDMLTWFETRGRTLEICDSSGGLVFVQIDIPFDADAAVELRMAWNAGVIEIDDAQAEPTRATYQGGSMWVLPTASLVEVPCVVTESPPGSAGVAG